MICKKKVGKKNVASLYVAEPFFVYVYEKKYHTRINYIISSDTLINNNHKLKQYLKKLKEPYLVVGAVNPEQMLLIKEQYPYLVSHQEDYYRNTSVFSKIKTSNVDVSVINTLSIFNSDVEIYVNDNKAFTHFGDSLDISFNTKDNTYPFNVTLPLQKSNLKHGQYMVADLALVVDSISDLANDQLCLTIGNGKDKAVFINLLHYMIFMTQLKKYNIFI